MLNRLRALFCRHAAMLRDRDAQGRPEFRCACGHREPVVSRTGDQWARQRSGAASQALTVKAGTRPVLDNLRSMAGRRRHR